MNKDERIPNWFLTNLNNKEITLSTYLTIWLNEVKENKSYHTYLNYSNYVNKHILPYLGNKLLSEVSPKDIEELYVILGKTIVKRNSNSNQTIYSIHSCLKKAFNDARREMLIVVNPLSFVRTPKVTKYEGKALSIEECKILLTELNKNQGSDYYLPTLLALFLGLRRGEIIGLKYEDINFNDNTLTIKRTFTGSGNTISFNLPKTNNSLRVITVSNYLMSKLKDKKEIHELERKFLGNDFNKEGFIFINDEGRVIKPQTWDNYFKRKLDKCNLRRIRLHDLRHTNASLMLKQGINMKLASTRLGHSNISITMDLYSHI